MKNTDMEAIDMIITEIAEKLKKDGVSMEDILSPKQKELKKINDDIEKTFSKILKELLDAQAPNKQESMKNRFGNIKDLQSDDAIKKQKIAIPDDSELSGFSMDSFFVSEFTLRFDKTSTKLLGKMKKKDVQFLSMALKATKWFESLKLFINKLDKPSFVNLCIVIDKQGFVKDFYIELKHISIKNNDKVFFTSFKDLDKKFDVNEASQMKKFAQKIRQSNKHISKKLLVIDNKMYSKLK